MQGITYQSNAIKASDSDAKKLSLATLNETKKKLSHATAVEAMYLALLAQVLRMTIH